MDPLHDPKQETLVGIAFAAIAAGCVIVTVLVLLHALASFTVAVYDPAGIMASEARLLVPTLVAQRYVYGVVPPAVSIEAEPLLTLLQSKFVDVTESVRTVGRVTVIVVSALHPLLSVRVDVYVPAVKLLAADVVCPEGDHKKL